MKKYLALLTFIFSSYSWGCLLLQGDIHINEDTLKVHQKVKVDENYPFKTSNFLVHLKILKENIAHIQVYHPKTLRVLIEKKVLLPLNTNTSSEASIESPGLHLKLSSQLTLKRI